MKTLASIFLGFLLVVSAGVSFSQPDTTHRARRADSLTTFFVGSSGPFDNWLLPNPAKEHFGTMSLQDTNFRWYNLDDTLGMNVEERQFWDYPHQRPAPPDTVLGGKRGQFLSVLILTPQQLFTAHEQAYYIRFEFERHTLQSEMNEYPGFLKHPGDTGLVGTNQNIAGATFPAFLRGSGRDGDTAVNAIQLNTATDTVAGVFADSMWTNAIFEGPSGTHQYFTHNTAKDPFSRKMLMRIRVKVNQTVDTAHPPILCTIRRIEIYHNVDSNVFHTRDTTFDTIRVDSKFKHVNSDFDTVELRFIRDRKNSTDLGNNIYFSFNWPKQVNAIFDYMELMTAHINATDNTDSIGNIGCCPNVADSEASAFSAEDFLAPNPINLGKLVSTIKKNYMGRATFLLVGDEMPSMHGLPFKRLVKMVRDSTAGKLEVCTFTVDTSNTTWIGNGLPDAHNFNFEGRRRGWVDTNYEDPRMIFYDPYEIADIPLPKRITTVATNTDSLKKWENNFMTLADTVIDSLTHPFGLHYSKDFYIQRTQFWRYLVYLLGNRKGRRWTERQNNGSHYGILWEAGTCPSVERQADQHKNADSISFYSTRLSNWLRFNSARPPTGPEMKVTGHLAASCGAVGLLLYQLRNVKPGINGGNGGIMEYDGAHDSMYYTTTAIDNSGDTAKGRVWIGFHERYDSVRALIPTLIKYGTTLLHAKCVGDWLASDLFLAPDSIKSKLPFLDTSIRAQDDSSRLDKYRPTRSLTDTVFIASIPPVVADTSNRTFVHISMWLDTTTAAKNNHSDTLLYITNMRTDDSYDTTTVPTTIDRRLITMRLKREHIIMDVADTNGGQLDDGRIWTPFVDTLAGDSLKLYLTAGDGILIRLMDTVIGTPMMPTRIAMTFPSGTANFNDKGRIKFDRYVPGVKNKTNDWSIPSSHLSYTVGISNGDTTHLWQDSLLYQRVDSLQNSRPGFWRQHHSTSGTSVKFGFKDSLTKSTTQRQPEFINDSVAHNIVIKTDLEGLHETGKIGLRDPFLVDSATLKNVFDTLQKGSPFLPHVLSAGRMPGADSQHYGGIFLLQNPNRTPANPIYTLKAYNILHANTYAPQDTAPYYVDWIFMNWAAKDTIVAGDISPWLDNSGNEQTYSLWNFKKNPQVIFGKDSAIYLARYKCHLGSFNSDVDSGLSWNNQRKLYYMGTIGGNRWYRMVYASNGRIFTVTGYRDGTNNVNIHWGNEQLVSLWDNSQARYPALGGHRSPTDTNYIYIYQDGSNGSNVIKLTKLDTNGITSFYDSLNTGSRDTGASDATPVIYGIIDSYGKTIDVAAWASGHGIVVKGIYAIDSNSTVRDTTIEYTFGDSTARHPTIWIDTVMGGDVNSMRYAVTLAWDRDSTMTGVIRDHFHPANNRYKDIYAVRFDVVKSKLSPYFYFTTHAGENGLNPKNVSFDLWHTSYDNRNPCISGARYDSVTSLIRIAYETTAYDSLQGISVVHRRDGSGWGYTKYFETSDTLNDKYTKPSIEVSRYHDSSNVSVQEQNYYSLTYEKTNGHDIEHWGMDNINQRLAPNIFLSVSNPQLAVVRESIDSDTYRMGLSIADPGAPHWLVSGYTALYKASGIDTLWGYNFIEESDSAKTFYTGYGMGEYAIDDGATKKELEILDRPESEVIGADHLAKYFTQSESFTLPASGTFSYYRWITVSDPLSYKKKFDTIMYALDFYDTTNTFVCRLDSIYLCDSVTQIKRAVSSITISRDSSVYGYVQMRRITSGLSTAGSTWEPIITNKRLSAQTSNKRSARPYSMQPDDILFTAEPNPAHSNVTVTFGIPFEGPVYIDVFNQLGLHVSDISNGRIFHAGEQNLIWHPGNIPSGVYYLQLRYGNSQKVVRVIYMR
jgi:hypothetical protein